MGDGSRRKPHLLSCVCLLTLASLLPRASDAEESGVKAFSPQARLVAAYYFNWYIDGATHKNSHWRLYPDPATNPVTWSWEPCYPKGKERGARIFGLDDSKKWPGGRLPDTSKWPDSDDWLFQIAEMRSAKWAGLDFVFVDIWPLSDFQNGHPELVRRGLAARDGRPTPELTALFKAWRWLDRRGEKPVKLSMFVDTPGLGADIDLRNPDGLDALWKPVRDFHKQFFGDGGYRARMPASSVAAMAGNDRRPRPVFVIFFPRMPGGEWVAQWDAASFTELRARFRRTFGLDPYICVNQHLHGPKYGGWNGVQKDGTIVDISRKAGVVDNEWPWFASLQGPLIRDDSIVISPGMWNRSGGHKIPGGATLEDGSPVYLGAYRYSSEEAKVSRYERDWLQVLSYPSNLKHRLLVIETWNELIEGTGVSPARPVVRRTADGKFIDRWGDSPTQYLELTRKYTAIWKKGQSASVGARPAPKH